MTLADRLRASAPDGSLRATREGPLHASHCGGLLHAYPVRALGIQPYTLPSQQHISSSISATFLSTPTRHKFCDTPPHQENNCSTSSSAFQIYHNKLLCLGKVTATIPAPLTSTPFTTARRLKSILKKSPTTTMPSVSRRDTMPTPAVIHTKAAAPRKARAVGFLPEPVTGVSRPVNTSESWAAYNFESHARKCAYCHNPYEVHRNHEQLCEVGHRLAQDVARYIYNADDGETYSVNEEGHKLVRVEIPAGYDEVRGLLKAVERSLRHRSRRPFLSMDRTYYIAARTLPERSHSVKVEQPSKPTRPRSGEIVDWPQKTKVTTEVSNAASKRGSLYEMDLAQQRRDSLRYRVEVRQPSRRDIREHRLSGYYR